MGNEINYRPIFLRATEQQKIPQFKKFIKVIYNMLEKK